MTSYHRRDYPNIKSLTHQFCCNQTCNNMFSITEDIRQKYCSKACSVAEASRRKNARKRMVEYTKAERKYPEAKADMNVRIDKAYRKILEALKPYLNNNVLTTNEMRELHEPIGTITSVTSDEVGMKTLSQRYHGKKQWTEAMETFGPFQKPFNMSSILKVTEPITAEQSALIKEKFTMRRHKVLFDSVTNEYRIILRDETEDPINEFYVAQDYPPFKNREAIHRVVAALNGARV